MVEAQMGLLRRPVRDVVDLLALGEPLDVEVISALTDPAVVEESEAYGLVSVERDDRRLHMRLSHPLYGEVRRSRVGLIRARRLRGQIARSLADSGVRGAVDTMRYAVLVLDSDLEPDPQLLIAAARSASNLVDLPLAERLARAAVSASGGFEPQLILAHALSFQSRGSEAEEVLAQMVGQVSTDPGRSVVVAVSRVANLFWVVRDATEAAAVLTDAEGIVNDENCRLVAAMRSAVDAGEGRGSGPPVPPH
jgi:hypothetical protein